MKREILLVLSLALTCQIFLGGFGFGPTACASLDDNFAGGEVTPKESAWGSSFTFRVVYTDSDNIFPSQNYPKVYLDGVGTPMEEKDSEDDNVMDGKTYIKTWTPGPENMGDHSFYFYVRNESGENMRCPENGDFEGPFVKGKPTEVSLEVKSEGGNMIFSGSLGVSGR